MTSPAPVLISILLQAAKAAMRRREVAESRLAVAKAAYDRAFDMTGSGKNSDLARFGSKSRTLCKVKMAFFEAHKVEKQAWHDWHIERVRVRAAEE